MVDWLRHADCVDRRYAATALLLRTSSRKCECQRLRRMLAVSSECSLNAPHNNATRNIEVNQHHNRIIRPTYNRAESATDFLDANHFDLEKDDARLYNSVNTQQSPRPSPSPSPHPRPSFQRRSRTRRSQSMRIAEDSSQHPLQQRTSSEAHDSSAMRKRSAANHGPQRVLTLEVPDRLAMGANGVHNAYSTPPSPQFVRTQPIVRKASINIANSGEWDEYRSTQYTDNDSSMYVPARADSYSRSNSCAASRDASPRKEETPVRSTTNRRLPSIVAVAHAQSSEALIKQQQNDAERNALLRRRFLRPQCAISDAADFEVASSETAANHSEPAACCRDGEEPSTNDAYPARSSTNRHSAEREIPNRRRDVDVPPDSRVRSGSANIEYPARVSIKRSETARTCPRNATSSMQNSLERAALNVARDTRRPPDAATRRLGSPRKVSSGSPQGVAASDLMRRNRAFSTVATEMDPKSSRSDSISSTRSTTGSGSTISDVSSLQYIELYRALKDREQLLEEIRESFKLFDKDGDGTVSKEEIAVVMRQFGLNSSDDEIQKMISEVDEDGNGYLDFNEFSKMMLARFCEIEQQDKTLQRVFRVFDKDGDGYIDAKELKRVMTSFGEALTDEEINEMIATADTDGDGKVSYEEFAKTLSTVGINGKAK